MSPSPTTAETIRVRFLVIAGLMAALSASQARAAEPELSIDAKRMLSYGALAVMTGICKPDLTTSQTAEIQKGLQTSAEAQHDLTQAQFTDLMKAVGAQVGQNKDQTCAALTPAFIDTSLKSAADGN